MAELSGQIMINPSQQEQQAFSSKDYEAESTLDEPVSTTIMRDVKKIGFKLRYVLLPKARTDQLKELRDWDLWGPLFLCLILAVTLSVTGRGSGDNSASLIFAIVFVLVWFGSAIVTMNAVLLGGSISFFQSVCALGYCLAPIDIAAVLTCTLPIPSFIKLIIALASMIWATLSASGFMSQLVSSQRKALAVYPVMLFYLFLSWFILIV